MTRVPLLPRRQQTTVEFRHDGVSWAMSIGHYPDGKPGELFLSCGKPGSAIEAVGRDAAILASLAIQYGCPPSLLRSSVTRDDKGAPTTIIGRALDEMERQC